jgi:hypothetical protein
MAALALCACEAVPDVVYTDGGAIVDGQVSDTNTCPSQVPPYATVCCGPIACTGTNCVATCSDCVARCGLLDLCCPNAQNRAVCKTNAQTCP